MPVRQFDIVVAGKTDEDLEDALKEVSRQLHAGNTSGFDLNPDSGFRFDSTSKIPRDKLPRLAFELPDDDIAPASSEEWRRDFTTHQGAWRDALVAAHSAEPHGGWARELRVFDHLYGLYQSTPGTNPAAAFGAHRDRWRQALEITFKNAKFVASEHVDDKSYWAHELYAFDRAFEEAASRLQGARIEETLLRPPVPRSSVDVELLNRIDALPGNATFTCYGQVLLPEGMTETFMQFPLDAQTLWRMVSLASAARDLQARGISLAMAPAFSDRELRTDEDTLDIVPGGHLPLSLVQYRARVDETDLIVESPTLKLDELLTRIEDAVVEGRTEIWLGEDPAEDKLEDALAEFSDKTAQPQARPRG